MFLLYITLLAASVKDGLTQATAPEEMRSVCGDNAVLKCKAVCKDGVRYQTVRWYKLDEEPSNKLSGLLMKRLSPNGTISWYASLEREVKLLAHDSLDIFLPNVTAADSAKYKCLLVAPIGEENKEGWIQLTVTGCPDQSTAQSMDTILILSIVGIVAALLIYGMSYVILRNMLLQRSKKNPQEPLLDAHLEKKVLKLIYTMEPNTTGQHSIKPICV